MPSFTFSPRPALASLALASLILPAWAGSGVQWEYTGSMQMMGMQMPMPATRVCAKAGSEMTPVDKRCQIRDVTAAGGKTRFHVSCGAPDPMEGDGEISRQGDTLQSVMHMKSAQAEMVLSQTGHPVGACELPK